MYCGRIVVPEYEGEEEYTAKRQHEAIISESTFNKVPGGFRQKEKKKISNKDCWTSTCRSGSQLERC